MITLVCMEKGDARKWRFGEDASGWSILKLNGWSRCKNVDAFRGLEVDSLEWTWMEGQDVKGSSLDLRWKWFILFIK